VSIAGPPAVHLIDASFFVFRAWYSVGLEMTDGDGQPVNALYGFSRFLGDLLEEARPEHVAVAFDESLTTSFRNEIFPAYKKNREPAPPELRQWHSGKCGSVSLCTQDDEWISRSRAPGRHDCREHRDRHQDHHRGGKSDRVHRTHVQ
jgi:hypothetical protein